MENQKNSDIAIYKTQTGNEVSVSVKADTIWLNQNQMSQLFDTERSVITKHIRNIYKENELEVDPTRAIFAQVQTEGGRKIERKVDFYNLDMIISVGYRVNSKNATVFRKWATGILKKYLVDGYTIDESKWVKDKKTLLQVVDLLKRTAKNQISNLTQAKELVDIVSDFIGGFAILDDYDNEKLDKTGKVKKAKVIKLDEFLDIIKKMKPKFATALFGIPRDDSFASSVGQIYQSFGDRDLYPGLEEKAATLLYLVVKNHSFTDGNKRIAATCFLHFLAQNNMLYTKNGTKIIDEFALAAITLLIAESKPSEMETMKRVVISILNRGTKK